MEEVPPLKDETSYLIWSNMHNGWWGPGECGYAPGLIGAGKYTREHALAICRKSIPNAAHHRRIATIPVPYLDVLEFTRGQALPVAIMKEDTRD